VLTFSDIQDYCWGRKPIFNVQNRLFNNINEMGLCSTEDCPGHFCVLFDNL